MLETGTPIQSPAALSAADAATLRSLDALVQETHLLWDEYWVGFSWRNDTL